MLKCVPTTGADTSYISWPINTIFVPRIGMYIRINIPKMDFIYLKIWCNSVILCQRGHFFLLTLYGGKWEYKTKNVKYLPYMIIQIQPIDIQ